MSSVWLCYSLKPTLVLSSRHRVQYVIPYEGSSSPDRDLPSGGSSVTKQEVDLVLGLLLGFCISWVLLWLDKTLHRVLRAWRTHPQKGELREKKVLYKVHLSEICSHKCPSQDIISALIFLWHKLHFSNSLVNDRSGVEFVSCLSSPALSSFPLHFSSHQSGLVSVESLSLSANIMDETHQGCSAVSSCQHLVPCLLILHPPFHPSVCELAAEEQVSLSSILVL